MEAVECENDKVLRCIKAHPEISYVELVTLTGCNVNDIKRLVGSGKVARMSKVIDNKLRTVYVSTEKISEDEVARVLRKSKVKMVERGINLYRRNLSATERELCNETGFESYGEFVRCWLELNKPE